MPSTESTDKVPAQQSAPASRDPFAKLAKWYDILHSSKNYNADALLYAKHLGAKPGDTVVEWGCGTGEFTRRFAGFGWKMIGVDASGEMLAVATQKEVPEWAHKPEWYCWHLNELGHNDNVPAASFACAPFAVISYAGISNAALLESFRRIRRHLSRGGRFVFDVVHAAAAAAELRADEVKEGGGEGFFEEVREHRRKTFHPNDCNIVIDAKTKAWKCRTHEVVDEFESTYLMRAFSPPELHLALNQCGFRVIDIFAPWSETGADEAAKIRVGDYYLMVVAEAV